MQNKGMAAASCRSAKISNPSHQAPNHSGALSPVAAKAAVGGAAGSSIHKVRNAAPITKPSAGPSAAVT